MNENKSILLLLWQVILASLLGWLLYYFRENVLNFLGGWFDLLSYVIPFALLVFIIYKIYKFYMKTEDHLNLLILANNTCRIKFNEWHTDKMYQTGSINLFSEGRRRNIPKIWDDGSFFESFICFNGISLFFNFMEKDRDLRNIKLQLKKTINNPLQKSISMNQLIEIRKSNSCPVCDGHNSRGNYSICDNCVPKSKT